ncbi:MAG TPA: amidohydrolase family protein, partial [Flavobacteriales bacterium]|nr:amidohydrolase family protein [Flavobacteriales bacterium]
MSTFTIRANVVDILARRIFPGEVAVSNGRIFSVREVPGPAKRYLLPGFVDAHVHVESSLLIPSEFARLAVVHGTVATVSDPDDANIASASIV